MAKFYRDKIIGELGLEMYDCESTTKNNEVIIEEVIGRLQRINYASDEIEVCFRSDYERWCEEPSSTIKSREVVDTLTTSVSEDVLIIESEEI